MNNYSGLPKKFRNMITRIVEENGTTRQEKAKKLAKYNCAFFGHADMARQLNISVDTFKKDLQKPDRHG